MIKTRIEPIEFATQKIETFVLKNFKKTNNNNDKYHTSDIIKIIKNNGLTVSDKKITSILNIQSVGKYKKELIINNKMDAGFTNIIFIGNKK
jgi:hypothetical protein